jgi:TM2 domain-containing membrane protein YozV
MSDFQQNSAEEIFCYSCGTKISKNGAFCPKCGAKQGGAGEPPAKGQAQGAVVTGSVNLNFLTLLLLCIFLGYFGGHRFYVRKTGTGVLMLLTGGGLGIWWIVDLITIISGKFKDKDGNVISNNNQNGNVSGPQQNMAGAGAKKQSKTPLIVAACIFGVVAVFVVVRFVQIRTEAARNDVIFNVLPGSYQLEKISTSDGSVIITGNDVFVNAANADVPRDFYFSVSWGDFSGFYSFEKGYYYITVRINYYLHKNNYRITLSENSEPRSGVYLTILDNGKISGTKNVEDDILNSDNFVVSEDLEIKDGNIILSRSGYTYTYSKNSDSLSDDENRVKVIKLIRENTK